MPLARGPSAIRCPRRSENDRIGDSARTTKNRGPAFIGAAMARSIGRANGASPFFARPTQFEAMNPSSISPASSRSAFSMLAEFDANTSTGANAGRRSNRISSARPWLWNVPSRSEVPMRSVMTERGGADTRLPMAAMSS
jgi:hypothetical protein